MQSPYLTDGIAIYAAVLSTITALVGWFNARPRMHVELLPAMSAETGSAACVWVRNLSGRTVHLHSVNLMYRYRHPTLAERLGMAVRFRRIRWMGWVHHGTLGADHGLPVAIDPFSSHRVMIASERIKAMMKGAITDEFVACAQDALGRNKYSRSMSVKWVL